MKKGVLLSSLLILSIVGCTNPILNNTSQYSDLDKEYSQFKTEALTQSYLKKKMDKWLSDGKYSKNLVREIEYAKFKHKDLLKDIVALQPTMFNSITGNTGVAQKRSESSFETYIQYINPFPSGVTATSATNITSSSFTANWNAVNNATGYKLYLDGSLTPITLGNVTTYNVTGLVDASSHNYYVKATNSAGESSVSNTINLTLPSALPIAPTANSASAITSSSFTANWTAVTGATGYKLYIDGTPITLGLVTTYNKTGLIEASSHNYYVKTINSAGDSLASNTINLTLLSAPPVANLATNVTATSFKANWNPFTGAIGYKLYLDGNATPITLGVVTSYDVTGLTKGTPHSYFLNAILSTGDTPYSNTISLYTVSDEFHVNSYTTNEQSYQSVAMSDDGSYVITWQGQGQGDTDGIYAQRYNSSGVAQGSEFKVNSYTTGIQSNPSIAMANDDSFIITWQGEGSGDSNGVFAKKYNADGSVNLSEFKVNTYTTSNQTNPAIAMTDDGKFIITWQGNGGAVEPDGIYAQKYNINGVANGSNFLVNTYTTDTQSTPAIAMNDDGKFVITWMSYNQDGDVSNYNVYAQKYNADGSVNDVQFRVNSFTTGGQYNQLIGMANDGSFVISWQSQHIDSGYNVYARKYNASGVASDVEFLVNTYTAGGQYVPSIAMADDGKFVISWYGIGTGDTDGGVFAQRYNSSGVANASNFLVNTYTNNFQQFPSTAIDINGNFVITWFGYGIGDNSGNYGVFAKRFDSNGNVL